MWTLVSSEMILGLWKYGLKKMFECNEIWEGVNFINKIYVWSIIIMDSSYVLIQKIYSFRLLEIQFEKKIGE